MGNYKKIDKDDILYIKNTIQDDERVLVGENINEEYSHDELSGTSSYPDVVVKAKSAEEIAAIMKYAYENTIPVTPRGAGTGLVGSDGTWHHDRYHPDEPDSRIGRGKPDGHGGTGRPFDGIVRLCRRSRFLLPAGSG